MAYRDDPPIQTILVVGETGALRLEIALSDIHDESAAWELLPIDRHRFEALGLSARRLRLDSPTRANRFCCAIYAENPLPAGVLRAVAEGTRADVALLYVPVEGAVPGAPILHELRDGGVNHAMVVLDTGFPAVDGDTIDRAEREARLALSRAGFEGEATAIFRGTTEGASQLREKIDWDDGFDDDDAAYDAYMAARTGWCDEVLTALATLPVLRTSSAIGPIRLPGGVTFACAACGLALTRTVHEVPLPEAPRDGEDYVPEGCFAVSTGARDAPAGQVIVSEEDVIHAVRLETTALDCCGHLPRSSGEHNYGCENGHPVGFSWATHWLPRFVGFDPALVVRRG